MRGGGDGRGRDVVYLSAVDWTFRRLFHHYICDEIVARSGRVVFIENTGARWPRLRDASRVLVRARRILAARGRSLNAGGDGQITVVPPVVLPAHSLTSSLNRELLRWQLRRAVPWLDAPNAVAWITLPNRTALDLLDWLRPKATIYFCADEFAAVPGIASDVTACEDELLRRSNIIFVTSERLRVLCSRFGAEPIFVPGGVDFAAFASAAHGELACPSPLRDVRGHVIGYIGGLNHKVDVELLEKVARAFQEDTIVVLGDVDDDRYTPAPARNLRVLPRRPHEELPAFLQRFDVCMIPYEVGPFTRSVYPAKLNEYLAAGRPVVSTALPEVLRMRDVVRVAANHEAFIREIALALRDDMTCEGSRRRVAAAKRNDYRRIIPPMLDTVDRLIARAGLLHGR